MKVKAHTNTLNCNRCQKSFTAPLDGEASEYYKGIGRVTYPLMNCPHCGMHDSHYIYERDNKDVKAIRIEP